MIQYQVKLKLTPRQERQLDRWLFHLTPVWNWAVKKIERDASIGIFHSSFNFRDLLAFHGRKIGVPQEALRGILWTAHASWERCFRKQSKKPRLKGRRNKLNSIAIPRVFPISNGRLHIINIGKVRFHKQDIPHGHISLLRLLKRPSGWYACLFIRAEPSLLPAADTGYVGIDPGFNSLLTLSSGKKIEHPRELEASAQRLAQAQRGSNQRQVARLHERITNRRKDRNHKLSRRLVSENQFIAFSADNHKGIAQRFGKSVASSSHYQLRSMLAYKSKCRTDGLGIYIEVPSRNSTRTCSACGALTGPTGWTGLSVRQWDCSACGAHHDRDTNAAMNTLIAGAGLAHEMLATAA